MMRNHSGLLALAWGLFCGLLMGALRTHNTALHLLEKNRSLENMGLPALPGTAELEAVIGWQPALAGGIFFALSFGLGLGALFFLWGALARVVPKIAAGIMLAVPSLLPLAALFKGEVSTAFFVVLIAALAGYLGFRATRSGGAVKGYVKRLAGVALILLIGLLPWALGGGSVPTELRNRVLLGTALGQSLNDYYYKWTLYPAEAIKPIGVRTQPTSLIKDSVSQSNKQAFCKSAIDFRILCVEGSGAVGDFTVSQNADGELLLTAGTASVQWPLKSPDANSAWKSFSQDADSASELRRITSLALRYGLPLAFLLFLALAVEGLGSLAFGARANKLTPLAAMGLAMLFFSIGVAGDEDKLRSRLAKGNASDAEVEAALGSQNIAMKVYGIIGAGKRAREFTPEIIALMDDPVVNVRYKAALAAGGLTDRESLDQLLATIKGSDQWYVKDRAYFALWRRGWRPL